MQDVIGGSTPILYVDFVIQPNYLEVSEGNPYSHLSQQGELYPKTVVLSIY